jgi:hypothetical protein
MGIVSSREGVLSIGRGGIEWSDSRPSLIYSRGISLAGLYIENMKAGWTSGL